MLVHMYHRGSPMPPTAAIVGSSISLPQNVDSREKLYELVR